MSICICYPSDFSFIRSSWSRHGNGSDRKHSSQHSSQVTCPCQRSYPHGLTRSTGFPHTAHIKPPPLSLPSRSKALIARRKDRITPLFHAREPGRISVIMYSRFQTSGSPSSPFHLFSKGRFAARSVFVSNHCSFSAPASCRCSCCVALMSAA